MLAVMFLAPGWLWLALALPLVWFVPRPLQDRVHGVLRTLVLLGVVAALAHPVSFTAVGEEWRVVVLDAHGSTQAQDAARAGAVAEALGAGGRGAGRSVLVHAAGTSVPASLVRRFDHVVTRQAGRSSSPLGALLASAGRAIPAGARGSITLLSDGLATDRRWGPAVQDLQARGLPVHVGPLRAEGRPGTLVGG
ncbi:MAG: hypothetical protein P1V36_14110, partial [Planctomycetota bacterium]|nr:hypothetical protein [Planctomycetota bacterium]